MRAPRHPGDLPPPLGVTVGPRGPQVAVLAAHAEEVEVCLFDEDGGERRVPLTRAAYGIWWDSVPDLAPGRRYGLRVHGPWAPAEGHRHNPAKLLLDPYAGALEGKVSWGPEVYGHAVDGSWTGDPDVRDERDSASYVPRSVVVRHDFDWGEDRPPAVAWTDTVVYEAHVKGLTMRHPGVPEELRGTYAALGHPVVVDHLSRLGVTTLELLPVHAFSHEPHLVRSGLTNYWGYNSLGFFAPHGPWAAASDPQGVVDEVKGAVRALHAAGIEVVLDVVYNHTCEQSGDSGATLSWRGLDNATYYRLDERGRDIDVTGCGNTVDLREPMVAKMVLDSLRHWVTRYHVDGFRFDLAPALARGRDDAYDPDHPFLVALRTDPVLNRVKLIAEPWDVGVHGWRTGQFPPPFAEWNDRFRDAARTFWLADSGREAQGQQGHGTRELAGRLAGSADLFGHGGRGTIASVNYVAAHDGFTLADATSYVDKHNAANLEANRDGHGDNRTWNHGVEGPTDDPAVLAARARAARSLLATLAVSAGVPMLCAGDELGRTQQGNNNAYCQDNEISWVDWEGADHDLAAATAELLRLRREHPVLRPRDFPVPDARPGRVRLRWYSAGGQELEAHHWENNGARTLVALFDDAHDATLLGREPDRVLVVLHAGSEPVTVELPGGMDLPWRVAWAADPAVRLDGSPLGDAAGAVILVPGQQ